MIETDRKAMKALIDKRHKQLENEVFKEMTEYYQMFEGKHWSKRTQNGAQSVSDTSPNVFVNWLFAVIMTNVPLLTDSRPIWHTIARRPHLQRAANVLTEAGKWLWRKEELDQKIFRVNLDAHIAKLGWWKVGFNPESDEVMVDVIDPRKVIWPAGFDDPKDCPWICYRDQLQMSEVRRMFPDMRDKILPDGEGNRDLATKSDWEIDGENKTCTFYEVWIRDATLVKDLRSDDRRALYPEYEDLEGEEREEAGSEAAFPNGRIVSFIAHDNTELSDVASPYEHGESPYVPFYDYVRPHNMVGISEADQMKTLNWAYNQMLQKLVVNANRYGGVQLVVDADSDLDAEDFLRKVGSGEDHVHSASFASGAPVIQVPIPAVPGSALNLLGGIPDLIEEVTGVTDVSKGVAEKRQRQSAMEVQILIESSYTRMRQRVRNLEWSLKRALTLITSVQQQFYTEIRNINVQDGAGVQNLEYSNQPQVVGSLVRDQELPETQTAANKLGEKFGVARARWDEDYAKYVEELGADEGSWPSRFYVDFDISLETNSSLPQDRQTLANLALRLFQMQAIDRKALLEVLQYPNAEDILGRLEEKERAKAGPPREAPAQPQQGESPQAIADRLIASRQAREGAAA